VPGYNLHDAVLRAAGVPSRVAGAADGVLLGCFVADRDAAAFAELVRRHGSMVLGVARRELGNGPDADDACQATFLVLARKAAVVRHRDAVGAWLYGVARQVARKALRKRLASRERERPESCLKSHPAAAHAPGSHDPSIAAAMSDLLHVLDEELGRLPDSYRAPLVLCYLEGRTQDEEARQLGWSLGAFRGRLERGRARLRDRLTRRGVGLAVLAAAAVARPEPVAAGMQITIINTAAAVAAGKALTVPAAVAALAEGAIRTMTTTKLQWAVGVIAVSGMLTVGGVWATGQGPSGPGQTPGAVPAQPAVTGQAKIDAPMERRAGASQRRKSMNNLRQIMLGVVNYEVGFRCLPADFRDKDGKPLLSWRVAILPFIDQDVVYREFKTNEPWDSEHNLKLLHQMPQMYRIGFEPEDATVTCYQAFAGPDTPLHPAFGQRISLGRIRDGASNTFGVAEAGSPVPWTKPADIPFDPKKPLKLATPFTNEWHVAMMDISAHALKRDIDPDVIRRLIMMTDGEQTPPLDTLRPPLAPPAETEAEKRELRKKIDENQVLVNRIRELMKEQADLLDLQNRIAKNIDQAEDAGDWLRKILDELQPRNKKFRDDVGLPAGKPVPTPNQH